MTESKKNNVTGGVVENEEFAQIHVNEGYILTPQQTKSFEELMAIINDTIPKQ